MLKFFQYMFVKKRFHCLLFEGGMQLRTLCEAKRPFLEPYLSQKPDTRCMSIGDGVIDMLAERGVLDAQALQIGVYGCFRELVQVTLLTSTSGDVGKRHWHTAGDNERTAALFILQARMYLREKLVFQPLANLLTLLLIQPFARIKYDNQLGQAKGLKLIVECIHYR